MTRENPGVPPNLDAATAADAPPQSKRLGVIYTIAPSAVRAPLVWIGTDDGYIHVTPDDGKTWQNATPRELSAWSKVVMLEASHFDANEAYAAVDRHRLTDNEPYVFRTKDGAGRGRRSPAACRPAYTCRRSRKIRSGASAGGRHRVGRVRVVQRRRRLAVAAAESAADLHARPRVSRQRSDRRHAWARVLGARRHQRAAAGDPDIAERNAHLFKPADAIIIPPNTDDGTPTQKDEPAAENPPTGAILDYYLKTAAGGPLMIEILNASGATIRRYSSSDSGAGGRSGHARSECDLAARAGAAIDRCRHASLRVGSPS